MLVRRHRSLSGWVRHSRCRGGLEDCISSTGRHRPSTPFRRRGVELAPTPCWVPKAAFKKSVSFADPLVTASWPLDASPASGKFKRGAAAADTNIQAAVSLKFANQFARPLTKDQMEAIMELVNQGGKKVGGPRRGCKVAPVKVPAIKIMQKI